ncbi:hypothetical protein AURDEDRAFT_176874 [Auricularia subglabra TFB-10046 SS5]|uniref:Uncharacterized protein n=1 Tax=Auricularia subglabra (strain TFB-10046 / SS5) TaxID=717982 RepID=J0D5M3_AURST|nr:hypothetical protein AURDEDRAFT_176874 [Auricularia subglabra TFB-10046 SS5]
MPRRSSSALAPTRRKTRSQTRINALSGGGEEEEQLEDSPSRHPINRRKIANKLLGKGVRVVPTSDEESQVEKDKTPARPKKPTPKKVGLLNRGSAARARGRGRGARGGKPSRVSSDPFGSDDGDGVTTDFVKKLRALRSSPPAPPAKRTKLAPSRHEHLSLCRSYASHLPEAFASPRPSDGT